MNTSFAVFFAPKIPHRGYFHNYVLPINAAAKPLGAACSGTYTRNFIL
jgi:hypothetical protein